MIQSEFNSLQDKLMNKITEDISYLFHKRSAGISLTECLVSSRLAVVVYMLDDVAAMSYNTAPSLDLAIPDTVKCSDITITFNKLKSYVFKRY